MWSSMWRSARTSQDVVGSDLERATIRRTAWRIIPLSFVLFVVNYFDRVNISYAQLQMGRDLGIGPAAFGFAAGIFFIGYFFFEIPSNLLLHRFGARRWIARIMVSWGVVVVLTAFVASIPQLIAARFILGIAEAGFAPGIFLYFTFWFPARYRGRMLGLWLLAIPFSQLVGAPLAGVMLDHAHWLDLASWRWLFVLTGIPAVLLGVVSYFALTDRPGQARWLRVEQREWLAGELAREKEAVAGGHHPSPWLALKDRRVVLMAGAFFLIDIGFQGVGFWLPQIIKGLSTTFTATTVGLISTIPFLAAIVAMAVNAWHSDRTRERRWHAGIPLVLAAASLFALGASEAIWLSILLVSLVAIGVYAVLPPYWAVPSTFLTGRAAASGIAAINSFGNLGGFVGPYLVGATVSATGNLQNGLYFLGLTLVVGAALTFVALRNSRAQSLSPAHILDAQPHPTSNEE